MYGVEVHESRNVSSRGYAFAKPIDKRYLAGTDGGGGDADGGSKEDRKLPSKGKDGDRERDGSCVLRMVEVEQRARQIQAATEEANRRAAVRFLSGNDSLVSDTGVPTVPLCSQPEQRE